MKSLLFRTHRQYLRITAATVCSFALLGMTSPPNTPTPCVGCTLCLYTLESYGYADCKCTIRETNFTINPIDPAGAILLDESPNCVLTCANCEDSSPPIDTDLCAFDGMQVTAVMLQMPCDDYTIKGNQWERVELGDDGNPDFWVRGEHKTVSYDFRIACQLGEQKTRHIWLVHVPATFEIEFQMTTRCGTGDGSSPDQLGGRPSFIPAGVNPNEDEKSKDIPFGGMRGTGSPRDGIPCATSTMTVEGVLMGYIVIDPDSDEPCN